MGYDVNGEGMDCMMVRGIAYRFMKIDTECDILIVHRGVGEFVLSNTEKD